MASIISKDLYDLKPLTGKLKTLFSMAINIRTLISSDFMTQL